MNTLTLPRQIAIGDFFLPFLFIIMWSSGYVVGKLGLHFAGPYTLIFIRFSSAAAIMFLVSLFTKARWPTSRLGFR